METWLLLSCLLGIVFASIVSPWKDLNSWHDVAVKHLLTLLVTLFSLKQWRLVFRGSAGEENSNTQLKSQ